MEFGYPHDNGDFSAAVRRCVGVAKCRNAATGSGSTDVMCPSFRATGEEQHSTRGRARLLHEMLAGEVITDGWRSPEVRDALDLCLSCKGCRSDCPVGVDMATYKAEFLHHHYEGRLRPAAHYSMGRLPQWLRAAPPRPRPLAQRPRRVPRWPPLGKRLGGIAPERADPALATETFTRWFAQAGAGPTRPGRRRSSPDGKVVILWPDTFTNHLSPQVGRAAVRVLEAAGLRRSPLPPDPAPVLRPDLCLHRPARPRPRGDAPHPGRHASRCWTATPLVVLEPSCAAALRTDLPELLPDDPRAAQLAAAVRTFARGPGGTGARLAAPARRPPRRRPDPLPPARGPRRRGRPPPARTAPASPAS